MMATGWRVRGTHFKCSARERFGDGLPKWLPNRPVKMTHRPRHDLSHGQVRILFGPRLARSAFGKDRSHSLEESDIITDLEAVRLLKGPGRAAPAAACAR